MLWASCHGQRGDRSRVGQVGDVEDLDALLVADEGVAELDLHGARLRRALRRRSTSPSGSWGRRATRPPGRRRRRCRRRCPTMVIAAAPLRMPSGLNVTSRFEEVVERVAVEQRAGADEDQPFVLVGDVEVAVERMDLRLRRSRGDACASGRGPASGRRRRRRTCVGT